MIAEPDDRRLQLFAAMGSARRGGAGLRGGSRRRGLALSALWGARPAGMTLRRTRLVRFALRGRGRVGAAMPAMGGRSGLAAASASAPAAMFAAGMGAFRLLFDGSLLAGLPIDLAGDQLLDVLDRARRRRG